MVQMLIPVCKALEDNDEVKLKHIIPCERCIHYEACKNHDPDYRCPGILNFEFTINLWNEKIQQAKKQPSQVVE